MIEDICGDLTSWSREWSCHGMPGYQIVPPDGSPIVTIPEHAETQPVPVYRTPSGKTGRVTIAWPNPRVIYGHDGSMFTEVVLPCQTGWGITYHCTPRRRSRFARFLSNYSEGIASGFPFWPVVVFSWRAARGRYVTSNGKVKKL